MSTSTRLILMLTVTVSAMMAAAGYFTLRQREAALVTAMRGEVRANALTLQVALEDDYGAGRAAEAERLINRLSGTSEIYGVLLYDESGRLITFSDSLLADDVRHPPELLRVLQTGETVEFARNINGEEVFSIIKPIHAGAERRGAFEIAHPLKFVQTDIAQARRNIALTTLLLCAVIFLVVLAATRSNLAQPIRELLGGAMAVGRGDLDYRVTVTGNRGEFATLAREFNRMADSLAEQKRAAAREAEERLALERELRHSERLATVGRLAAGVAHEIGAPLQVIDGRAKQLLEHAGAPLATRQRNLTIVRAQTERIARIVRQLLNLARPYNLDCQAVDLAQLLAGTLELVEAQAARAGVEIELAIAERVLVEADPDLLHQVFLNICSNGIQAMPTGGRLRIECVPGVFLPGVFMNDGKRQNGQGFAAVRVSDAGRGIAPEHLPHIFEPFYTTKEVGEGTGLGLAVSSRIVEEHGGWIEAANNAEGGATFTVYLPKSGQTTESVESLQEGVA